MTASHAHARLGAAIHILRTSVDSTAQAQADEHHQLMAEVRNLAHLRPRPTQQQLLDAGAIKHTRRRNRALMLAVLIGLIVATAADRAATRWNAARIAAEFQQ